MTKLDFELTFQELHLSFNKVQEGQITEISQNCLELGLPRDSLQHFKYNCQHSSIPALSAANHSSKCQDRQQEHPHPSKMPSW